MQRLLVAIAVFCCATTAQADIIQITSGYVTVTKQRGEFSFGNDMFSASGIFPSPIPGGNWSLLDRYFMDGSEMGVHGIQTHNDLGSALITIGEETYDVSLSDLMAEKGSGLEFTGPSVLLDHGAGFYSGSFTFDGWICGVARGPSGSGDKPCIVDFPDLFGFGTVSFEVLDDVPVGQLYRVDSATYTFEDPAAVPEPGTLALLALGLAGLGLREKSRQRP